MQIRTLVLGFVAAGTVLFTSCGDEKPKNETTKFEEEAIPEELELSTNDKVRFQRAKIVLFSLPSPMETAKILKKSGAIYDPKYLSSPENLDKHETSKDKAIAMGVFITDLSYANVFVQQQACMDYFAAISEISNDLSLNDVFTQDLIERVDKHISKEDSVLKYLTEAYWKANMKLKADDRESMAGLIAAGSWIEGLYIATHLVDPNSPDDPVVERLAEQASTLKQLIKFLSSFKDDKNLMDVIKDLETLEQEFDKIEVETVRVENKTGNDGVAVVGKKKVYKMSSELLNEIVTVTEEIRNKYI